MWTYLRSLLKALSDAALAKVSKSDFIAGYDASASQRNWRKVKKIDKALWNCYTGLIPGGVGHCLCIKTMQRGGMYQVMRSQYPYRCQVTPLNRSYVQILRTAAISSLLRMSHVTSKISHSRRHFLCTLSQKKSIIWSVVKEELLAIVALEGPGTWVHSQRYSIVSLYMAIGRSNTLNK